MCTLSAQKCLVTWKWSIFKTAARLAPLEHWVWYEITKKLCKVIEHKALLKIKYYLWLELMNQGIQVKALSYGLWAEKKSDCSKFKKRKWCEGVRGSRCAWSPAESFLQLHCSKVGFQLAINFVSECEAEGQFSAYLQIF